MFSHIGSVLNPSELCQVDSIFRLQIYAELLENSFWPTFKVTFYLFFVNHVHKVRQTKYDRRRQQKCYKYKFVFRNRKLK